MQAFLLLALFNVAYCVAPDVMAQKHAALRPRTFPRPVPPTWTQSWAVRNSTAIYACNYSGMFDDSFISQFALVALDWSHAKEAWANAHPMSSEQAMIQQVERIQSLRPGAITLVYRNTVM